MNRGVGGERLTIVRLGAWVAPALALLLSTQARADDAIDSSHLTGLITDERVSEISGMAASARHPGVLWVHNDGDHEAALYALDEKGTVLSRLRLDDAVNLDWEDMARWEHEGRSYLVVADTGDNGGLRTELTLYAVEEPDSLDSTELRAPLAWRQRFRWPDGPRDCEAMAVDPDTGDILLISKKRVPPELFRVRRTADPDGVATAERIALLNGVDQPTEADLRRNPVYGRYRSQITGTAIDPQGRALVVLNYRIALVYSRSPGESWRDAVSRMPQQVNFPWLPQAEAVSFAADGSAVYIASEKVPAPLIRLDVER